MGLLFQLLRLLVLLRYFERLCCSFPGLSILVECRQNLPADRRAR